MIFSCTDAVSLSPAAGPIMRVTQLGMYTTRRGMPPAAAGEAEAAGAGTAGGREM